MRIIFILFISINLFAQSTTDVMEVGQEASESHIKQADPISPYVGEMWFNSTTGTFKFFDGTNIIELGQTGQVLPKTYKPYWIYPYADFTKVYFYCFSDDLNTATPVKIIANGQEFTTLQSIGSGEINGNFYNGYSINLNATGDIILQAEIDGQIIENRFTKSERVVIHQTTDLNQLILSGNETYDIVSSIGTHSIKGGLNKIGDNNIYSEVFLKEI